MEGLGGSTEWGASVKEEPEYVVDVCIKIEVELEDQLLDPKAEFVQPEPECVKPLWGTGGLYTDHDVKDELVLGPELLQRMCADKSRVSSARLHCEGVEIASTEKETKRQMDITIDLDHTTAMNTYMCDSCGKLFKKKQVLIRHIKTHLQGNLKHLKIIPRNNKKVLFCEICNKRFTQTGHYNRHVLTHAAGKPHVCDICNKQFQREDCLRVHLRIHAGQQPYACQFCGKRFTQACNLRRHVRVHTGEKPYVCDVCNKRCSQSQDLRTHKRIHELANTPYSCDGCSRKFKQKAALDKHKKRHWRQKARDIAKKA